MSNINLISIERIEKTIYLIRREKVMLDNDLAELYQVSTKRSIKPYAAMPIGFLLTSCSNFRRKKFPS